MTSARAFVTCLARSDCKESYAAVGGFALTGQQDAKGKTMVNRTKKEQWYQ